MEIKCPVCASVKIDLGATTLASDGSYADVIANCKNCGAELNIYLVAQEITEEQDTQ